MQFYTPVDSDSLLDVYACDGAFGMHKHTRTRACMHDQPGIPPPPGTRRFNGSTRNFYGSAQ